MSKAVQAGTEDGACVSAGEATRIFARMRSAYPTMERVARMPAEALDALNVEGVSWELSQRTCPGADNPVR